MVGVATIRAVWTLISELPRPAAIHMPQSNLDDVLIYDGKFSWKGTLVYVAVPWKLP